MSVLKVYSLRLESAMIDRADDVAGQLSFWSRSEIIRLAIWIGQKVVEPRVVGALHRLWWQEQFKGTNVTLEDVIRTAGIELENLKSQE